ncbi:MAG: hypothetical protein IIY36_09650 [Lachnospiraceae bacterium]|nr:hypothetical protein [Lachnospiraceae bacterium]
MNICFRPCTVEDLPTLCSFSRKLFFEAFRDTCSPEDLFAPAEKQVEGCDNYQFVMTECHALIYPPICDYLLNSDDYDPNKDE